tara:strand:- start:473 stop:2194 length:1722 start_codon:yes stop_codon:yes gene_type:complete
MENRAGKGFASHCRKECSSTLLLSIMQEINEGVICVNSSERVVCINDAAIEITERDRIDSIGFLVDEVINSYKLEDSKDAHNLKEELAKDGIKESESVELHVVHGARGGTYTALVSSLIVDDVTNDKYKIITIRNITNIRTLFQRLRQMAQYDHMTGLPNRVHFRDVLKQQIASCTRHDRKFALLYVDLDNFKRINDVYGHAFGDEVIVKISKKLQSVIREEDIVSRFGGDEFLILITDIHNKEDVCVVAENIHNTLKGLRFEGKKDLDPSVSLGISLFPEDGDDEDTLTRHADIAMYEAKSRGKKTHYLFTDKMRQAVARKMEIERLLSNVLYNNELYLVYQPIWNIKTKSVDGAEALLRWNSAELGLVSPLEIIPIAEKSGIIVKIGWWVIDSVCKEISEWQRDGIEMPVSVNLSAMQLFEPDFVHRLKAVTSILEDRRDLLTLELTESSVLKDPEKSKEVFEKVSALGVRIAIDSFGTGYSSLSYLQDLHVHELKVDRTFISKMQENPKSRAIVKTIVSLGEGLGIRVVAKGIENERERDSLLLLGCEQGQGSLFSEPVDKTEFEKLFKA